MKKLFKLAVIVLIANAAYRFGPPYVRYTRFKQELPEVALGAKGKPDQVIATEVMNLAAKHKVPLARTDIDIKRTSDLLHTYIDTAWVEQVAVVPSVVTREVRFAASADGYHYTPPSGSSK